MNRANSVKSGAQAGIQSNQQIYNTPPFYQPERSDEIWIERAQDIAQSAKVYREKYRIQPALRDKEKIAVFGIDVQLGFVNSKGSLSVPGAVDDVNRALSFIYRNVGRISSLQFSMDTHRVFQIFHPSFWIDEQGNHPAPFTPITTADIKQGKWRAIQNPKLAYEYCEMLQQQGKKVLVVWPYHTLLGGVSHALVPAVMEAAIFHSIARHSQTHFETKGTHQMTENYSVLEPEVKKIGNTVVGELNTAFLDLLLKNDRIYIWGEASSHCVAETVWSLERYIKDTDPSLMNRIYILEDAMSPVPKMGDGELDFPVLAQRAIDGFRDAGMNVVKTTDPMV